MKTLRNLTLMATAAFLVNVIVQSKALYAATLVPCSPAYTLLEDECCYTPGTGEKRDNCAAGKTAEWSEPSPGSWICDCKDANEALGQLFGIINGIMTPLTIIAGFFLIVLAGYKILKSQGNPAELQAGKENLTSAIIGLIFVLMAVSILRVIIKALITGNADPFS